MPPSERHRISAVDAELRIGDCSVCGPRVKVAVRTNGRRECQNQRNKHERTPTARVRRRESQLRNLYGITSDDWQDMFDVQEGCCALCGKGAVPLVVDHCHESGRVRGLLCQRCNKLLAKLGDDRGRRLSTYLA